jgi:hypothetical protein
MPNYKFSCFCDASAFYIHVYEDKIQLWCPFCHEHFDIRQPKDFDNWKLAKEFTRDLNIEGLNAKDYIKIKGAETDEQKEKE